MLLLQENCCEISGVACTDSACSYLQRERNFGIDKHVLHFTNHTKVEKGGQGSITNFDANCRCCCSLPQCLVRLPQLLRAGSAILPSSTCSRPAHHLQRSLRCWFDSCLIPHGIGHGICISSQTPDWTDAIFGFYWRTERGT